MKNHILVVRKDGQSGELGLVLEEVPANDDLFMVATDGAVVAHDLIEHVNGLGSIGSVHDELQALGGIWFVRGQHGELRRDRAGSAYSIEFNIASDIVRMWRELDFAGYEPCPPNQGKVRHCEFEESFSEIVRIAREEIMKEDDDKPSHEVSLDEYLDSSLRYMRIGARRCHRRWRGDSWRAYTIFWDIADAVDKVMKDFHYQGQRYVLHQRRRDESFICFDEDYRSDYL